MPLKAAFPLKLENAMSLKHIEIVGDCPNFEQILEDISYIEGIFFKNSNSTSKEEQPAPQKTKPSKKFKDDNSKDYKSLNNPKDNNEKHEAYPEALQIFLRDVGDRITARFVDSGNRFIKKSGRDSFVVYLKDKNGELIFLSGTQLQEEIDATKPKAEQRIMIEKTSQFKRAKDRSHAKPAVFKITKLD